jgi:hypothetical protein
MSIREKLHCSLCCSIAQQQLMSQRQRTFMTAVVPLAPHTLFACSYLALDSAATTHKTSEMPHVFQCLMVNIRYVLNIFEEGAGNTSVSLQTCIMTGKHVVYFMSKSCKLRELHDVNSGNFIFLLCCQSAVNIT